MFFDQIKCVSFGSFFWKAQIQKFSWKAMGFNVLQICLKKKKYIMLHYKLHLYWFLALADDGRNRKEWWLFILSALNNSSLLGDRDSLF